MARSTPPRGPGQREAGATVEHEGVTGTATFPVQEDTAAEAALVLAPMSGGPTSDSAGMARSPRPRRGIDNGHDRESGPVNPAAAGNGIPFRARERPAIATLQRWGAGKTSEVARSPHRGLEGQIDAVDWTAIKGWVWSPETPGERIRLELLDDETPLVTTIANEHRPELVQRRIGDGGYGFSIEFPDLAEGRHILHLRCADTGVDAPGSPIVLNFTKPAATAPSGFRADLVNAGAVGQGRASTTLDEVAVTEQSVLEEGPLSPVRDDDRMRLVFASEMNDGADRALTEPDQGRVEGPRFQGYVDGIDAHWRLSGWAYDPDGDVPLTVELAELTTEGEAVIASARANQLRADLLDAGLGQGECSFYILVPPNLLDGRFHNLRVYGTESTHRELIGKPFGIVLPRLGLAQNPARTPIPAIKIFQQFTYAAVPTTPRPGSEVIDEITSVLQQIGARFGHAAALGLLYAYVLRRPIDNDGLVTRLTRIHTDLSEYKGIVEEVIQSEEAVIIHGPSRYLTLHPLECLSVWLNAKFSILEIPG